MKKRLIYQPAVPEILKNLLGVHFKATISKKVEESILKHFPKTAYLPSHELVRGAPSPRPLNVGLFFSGGPAPGGHNVIWGVYEAIQTFDPNSKLIAFLNGPAGAIENHFRELKRGEIDSIRNQGGFDLIGTGRTKIETVEQMASVLRSCKQHGLDGLIVIGGDDSNTNAAHLAEYFMTQGCATSVIGMPKTIDGDLRSDEIVVSFGFDTACKTYSELIGNISRDAKSTQKYTHFIKLMGRSASHIALECALSTQPNLTFIGEEGKRLDQVIQEIIDLIQKRKEKGRDYGVVLIPEGLIEFIPEINSLIQELNRVGSNLSALKEPEATLFEQFPEKIKNQLLMDRDPHGNVKVSQIETEQLLSSLVKKRFSSFSSQEHFLGYEGRCAFPTNFDANYAYALGLSGAVAIRDGLTGMILAITHLSLTPTSWGVKAVPISSLMRMEERKGKSIPVVQKAVVDMNSKPFVYFSHIRKSWEIEDRYRYPGPIQFWGDADLTDAIPITLMENYDYCSRSSESYCQPD